MIRCSNCRRYVAEWDALVCLHCEKFFCRRCRDEHYEAMEIVKEDSEQRADSYDSIQDNTDTDQTKSLNSL